MAEQPPVQPPAVRQNTFGDFDVVRAGIVATAVFLVITLLVAFEATTTVDDWWNTLMVDIETSWLVDVADVLGVLGSTTAAIAIAVLGVIGFISARRWLDGVAVIAMAVSAFVVAQLVKLLIDRPRPPDGLDIESSASYPSASVMVSATAIVLGIAVLALRTGTRFRASLVGFAVGYVVLMAWSRTYLRVHWLTDVAGGSIGGIAIVLLVVTALYPSRASRTQGDSRV